MASEIREQREGGLPEGTIPDDNGTHGKGCGVPRQDIIVVGTLTHKAFGYGQNRRVFDIDGICPTIDTSGGGNREVKVLIE